MATQEFILQGRQVLSSSDQHRHTAHALCTALVTESQAFHSWHTHPKEAYTAHHCTPNSASQPQSTDHQRCLQADEECYFWTGFSISSWIKLYFLQSNTPHPHTPQWLQLLHRLHYSAHVISTPPPFLTPQPQQLHLPFPYNQARWPVTARHTHTYWLAR